MVYHFASLGEDHKDAAQFKVNMDTPLLVSCISTGFASPADDYIENPLDLNRYLVANPSATFYFKVSGSSMAELGILENDLLVVDRSLNPVTGSLILIVINGEICLRKLGLSNSQPVLQAFPKNQPPIISAMPDPAEIWGVLSSIIRKVL